MNTYGKYKDGAKEHLLVHYTIISIVSIIVSINYLNEVPIIYHLNDKEL